MTYYKSKPSWGQSSGSGPKGAPTLDFHRSPSGGYSLPPAPSRKGYSVPEAGKPYPGGTGSPKGKISVPGMMRRAKSPLQFGYDLAKEWAGGDNPPEPYGWDDFMDGKMPPPFDFMNYESPNAPWNLPLNEPMANVKTPVTQRDRTFGVNSPMGNWRIALPPGVTFSGSTSEAYGVMENALDGTINPNGYSLLGWTRSNKFAPGAVVDPQWLDEVQATTNWRYWVRDQTVGQDLDWIGVRLTTNQPSSRIRFTIPMPTLGSSGDDSWSKYLAAKNGLYTATVLKNFNTHLPNWMVPIRNEMALGFGQQVRIPPDPPVAFAEPPPPGTKEKKSKVRGKLLPIAQGIFHGVTEYQDALDAIHDALPKKYQATRDHILAKSWAVWKNLEHVDVGDALVNLAWNQFEDYVLGKGLFGLNQKAAAARGDQYGFRTLNSMNDVGNLEQLGEMYGDFSKEYVNPNKEALKSYLTAHYGI